MDLTPYVDNLHRELAVAAAAGGDDARALAERLIAPLESAVRLTLLNVLSAAADDITRDLAPGSVELRLRGGDPEFVVKPPPGSQAVDEGVSVGPGMAPSSTSTGPRVSSAAASDLDEGTMSRINLRLPEQVKARIEQAAGRERLSTNAWLVRAAVAALDNGDRDSAPRSGRAGQHYTGWVR